MSAISIAILVAYCIGVVAVVVRAVRNAPAGQADEAFIDVFVPGFLVAWLLYGIVTLGDAAFDSADRHRHELAMIAAIEDRYDITIDGYFLGQPGDWKIDGEWIRCYIPDEDAPLADVSLSCDPGSRTAGSYVDFADIN